MFKNWPGKKAAFLFALTILLLSACGTPYQPEEEDPEEEEDVPESDEVPPDPTLETVTWNLNWYGSGFRGPSNQDLQTQNIVEVTDSLEADLYAFQEVHDQDDLNNIVENMKGYQGFVGEFPGNQSQKMAFVYNTNTIDSLEAGVITDAPEDYKNEWGYYWAGGRLPLFFKFTFTFEITTKEFYAVVIHGKANYGDNDQEYAEAYERRKKAAEGLYQYLMNNKPAANIILLGDYNDDVDQSIYYDNEGNYKETPYYQFVNDTDDFDVITKDLSDAGESASINYPDIIDHITISNELFENYVQKSTAVYYDPQSYIEEYEETTSDHLPVWAKFDVTKSKAIVEHQ